MFMLNNKPLPLDRAFTVNDVQYPSNWLRLSTLAEKQALGITEVPDPVRADDRFYWNGDINNPKALEDKLEVKEDGSPLMVQRYDAETESMVDTDVQVVTKGLKSNMIAQVKATAGTLLAQTDWMVIRKAERDVPIDPDTVTYRAGVIAEANRLETAIAACADVDALIAVMNAQSWPE
jgi:hypothetical protein